MLKVTLQLSAAAVFILGCSAVAKRALPQISSTSHRRRSGAACARPSSGPATAACRTETLETFNPWVQQYLNVHQLQPTLPLALPLYSLRDPCGMRL